MTPEKWSVVNSIFHDVADLPPEERAAALEAKSGGDNIIKSAVDGLLFADASNHSYLDRPAARGAAFQQLLSEPPSTPPLLEGDLLCGRFRIVRLVGEGGMGQVYEAIDLELHVRLALKVIRPEIAAEEDTTRRFRHEVRLARSITHTNVCRTFDLERGPILRAVTSVPTQPSAELLFLTMEFVDGETLAARIARKGALPADQALRIAEQIADGIRAAHEHGVIHRDLKPHNILLAKTYSRDAETLRVVITDFGLARLDRSAVEVAEDSSSNQQMQAAGTLAYMAPEQILGGQVTIATDIYSFGLVLFEMATGARAFPGESFLQDLGSRFGTDPPSPRSLNAAISDAWNATVIRCLAQQPADRFKAVGEVTAALHGVTFIVRRDVQWHWLSRRILAGIASAALLVSCFALFVRYRQTEAISGSVSPGALVYMPAIRNETANQRLNDVAQMMTASLAQSSRIGLLDQAQEADILQRMMRPVAPVLDDTTAREVGMRSGASRVLIITLKNDGDLLRLFVTIEQPEISTPEKARNHWDRSWTCTTGELSENGAIPADLLHIIRDAADWVRQIVGEAKEDIATLNVPLEDLTTMNWDALAEYSKAERLRQEGKSSDAVIALRNATVLDPGFALAYGRMGDILFSIERNAEGIKAYQQALEAGGQRRLTRRERDRLRGLYAIDTWDYATAESIFRDATIYYDHDYLSWFYRGSMLMRLGRLSEAEEVLKRAWEMRPASPSAPFTLASTMFMAGERKGALEVASTMRAKGYLADALWLEAEDQYLQGNAQTADNMLLQIDKINPPSTLRVLAVMQRVRLSVDRDHPETALALLEEGMEKDRKIGSLSLLAEKQIDRAYLECEARKYASCIDDVRNGLRADPNPRLFRAASEALSEAVRQCPSANVIRKIHDEFRQEIADQPGVEYGVSAEIVRAQLKGGLLLSEGKAQEAARLFRKIAVMDVPTESSFRLGGSLAQAASIEDDPRSKRSFLRNRHAIISPRV